MLTSQINKIIATSQINTQQSNIQAQPGDTVMHRAARVCTSANHFMELLKTRRRKNLISDVTTFNDKGETVFQVINNSLPDREQREIRGAMLTYALQQKVKPLSKQISFAKLIEKYQLMPGTELYNNFKAAVMIMNMTRRVFLHSNTHPEANRWSLQQLKTQLGNIVAYRNNAHHRTIDALIKNADIRILNFTDNDLVFTCKLDQTSAKNLLGFKNHYYFTQSGNCQEMAEFAHQLGTLYNIPMGIYEYAKGDHIFNSVGYEFSPNSIFCDCWAGQIFPKDEINKLGDLYSLIMGDRTFNIAMKYNPNFHKIVQTKYIGKNLESSYRIIFKENFVDNLIKNIMSKLQSEKEMILFAQIIRHNLQTALDQQIISFKDVEFWASSDDVKEKLKKLFSSEINLVPYLTHLYKNCGSLFHARLLDAIRAGSDINLAANNGETAILAAALFGYTETVQMLLNAGANQNCAYHNNGATPLLIAVQLGKEDIVDLLLAKTDTDTIATLLGNVDFYRSLVNSDDEPSKAQRMELFIARSVLSNGNNLSRISMNAIELAEVMGHQAIAFKIRKYTEQRKTDTMPQHTDLFELPHTSVVDQHSSVQNNKEVTMNDFALLPDSQEQTFSRSHE